eukprot:scaffold131204_cov24-Phaeocystis_antarctica.AAC.1
MSALSLALRQSACESERSGSGALHGVKGIVAAACSHTEQPECNHRVLLAPAARPLATAPPRSPRSRTPPAPPQRPAAAPCSSPCRTLRR